MFDPACTLLHKCLLSIIPSADLQGPEIMKSVLTTVSEHIHDDTGVHITCEKLLGNFTAESHDRLHRLLVNYIADADAPYPVHWAIRIKSGDPTARHRIYTQHIGIRQTSAYELSVHIATTSTDHLGGRFSTFRPPVKRVSPLVDRLFSNTDIRCVTGNHVLLNRSMRLTNQSIEYFLNLLYEKTRTLPVILVTCTDLINPDLLHSYLLGNAIVCSTGDPGIVMMLNDYLPEPLRLTFGSIRIYVPFCTSVSSSVFHPVIPLSDIYRITPAEVINMLYRAYAENFRQQELHSFITTETCADLRTRQYISGLKSQLATALETLKKADAKYAHLQNEYEQLSRESSAENNPPTDEVYESLLGEYASELTLIKEGLQYLVSQTYGTSQVIAIPDGAHSLVIDLINSVNYRQMRPRSSSRKKGK